MKQLLIFSFCLCSMFNVAAQKEELSDRQPSYGVGLHYRVSGGYFTEFNFRPYSALDLQAIAGYAYHKPQILDFNEARLSGVYAGLGFSILTAPLRQDYDPDNPVQGSFKIGTKVVRGLMNFDAEKTFNGTAYNSHLLRENHKKVEYNHFELSVGVEFKFYNKLSVSIAPIFQAGDSEKMNDFRPDFIPVTGRTRFFTLGYSLHYFIK